MLDRMVSTPQSPTVKRAQRGGVQAGRGAFLNLKGESGPNSERPMSELIFPDEGGWVDQGKDERYR